MIALLARTGFASKGIVYLLLGLLALRAGIGEGGRVTDPLGALATLLAQPFGRLALSAIAVGLALYALWRFLEAFADANRVGRERKALATRLAWGLSGAAYALLSVDTARLVIGRPRGSDAAVPDTLLTSPLAPWLISVIAIAVIAYGIKELRAGFAHRLSERLNLRQLSRESGPLIVTLCRVGLMARALTLIALGIVLLRARSNPYRASAETDISDSLQLIAALSAGPWLFVPVAAGLMAYGIYQLVHARYRQIVPP